MGLGSLFFGLVNVAAAIAAPVAAQCSAPSGYYASVDTRTATTLRSTLHARIDDHQRVSWSGTWAVLERADQDPASSSRILDVYGNASYAKAGGGNNNYDREHVWPKSLGFAQSSGSNYPESDCHGLFLSRRSHNGARANKMFRTLSGSATEWTTIGGGSGIYPGRSNWTSGSGVSGGWETWVGRRGDIARAMFYFDVRYDGSRHSGGATEPDLVLTDDVNLIVNSQSQTNLPVAYMGLLSVLLDWHRQDPPDAKECLRNEMVYQAQGNRNPFIDHPEWVARIWGGGSGGGGNERDVRKAWVNEFHYDNAGTDQNEMIEVAGPAGLDVSGWRLVAYNSSGGRAYKTVSLSGVLSASSGCIGTMSVPFSGLQNGPADAFALVDAEDQVVEFLSYEGVMTATDGAAQGMTSVDVGVSETNATPAGQSLQLGGSGRTGPDFGWQAPQSQTAGLRNAQQTFLGGCGLADVYGCGENPAGSILLVAGSPSIGATFTIGLHNPLGTQSPSAGVLLAVSVAAPPGYPCGVLLPGFGMRSAAMPGAFLVNPTLLTAPAPTWTGAPSVLPLPLPNDNNLVGARFYLQGALLTPGASNGIEVGLTEGMRVEIGL